MRVIEGMPGWWRRLRGMPVPPRTDCIQALAFKGGEISTRGKGLLPCGLFRSGGAGSARTPPTRRGLSGSGPAV